MMSERNYLSARLSFLLEAAYAFVAASRCCICCTFAAFTAPCPAPVEVAVLAGTSYLLAMLAAKGFSSPAKTFRRARRRSRSLFLGSMPETAVRMIWRRRRRRSRNGQHTSSSIAFSSSRARPLTSSGFLLILSPYVSTFNPPGYMECL